MMKFARRRFVQMLGALPLAACASSSEQTESDDAITDIPNTSIKDQRIGNCWAYALCAWAESLHIAHGGRPLDLSENYLTYMTMFARVVDMQVDGYSMTQAWPVGYGPTAAVSLANPINWANFLVMRFGFMRETAFSGRPATAFATVNREVQSGRLATAAARKDRELVRKVFDEAFGLSADTRRTLDRNFGRGLEGKMGPTPLATEDGFIDPRTLGVGRERDTGKEVPLSVLIGDSVQNFDLHWQRQEGLRWDCVIPLLNAGWPVPIAWRVDGRQSTAGEFALPFVTPARGSHESVIVDYQATLPGHGTIRAGSPVRDPGVLAALERGEGTIDFYRLKNSWGVDIGLGEGQAPGFTDVTPEYLRASNLENLFVPQGGTRDDFRDWMKRVDH